MTGPPPRLGASRSYQGQDLFVLDVLEGLHGGFFLDSGASDGVSGSNTYLLESAYGWSGICIEPNATLFADLVRNRRCTCLNYCLYDREGPVEFFEGARVFGGILQEYDPVHLRHAMEQVGRAQPGSETLVEQKTARRLGSVLRACGAPRVIDYWSLDTEGSELAILRDFPFGEYVVRVLTVEHNLLPVREDLRELLERRGYRHAASLGIDDAYVWGGDTPAWRSRAWSRRRGVPTRPR